MKNNIKIEGFIPLCEDKIYNKEKKINQNNMTNKEFTLEELENATLFDKEQLAKDYLIQDYCDINVQDLGDGLYGIGTMVLTREGLDKLVNILKEQLNNE